MFSKSVVVASVLATLASAQTLSIHSTSGVVATTTIAQAMPATATSGFNAGLANSTVRSTWCMGELNTCPQICGGFYSVNTCSTTDLTYSCVCANGTVPDVTAFMQTLPFFICQNTYIQCINAHPDDLAGQEACKAAEQCGTRNATAEALAAASGSSSSAIRSTSTVSGSGTASAAGSASSTKASTSATANAAYSTEVTTGAFAAVLMAAFKLLL